jgi:hypothetical protein
MTAFAHRQPTTLTSVIEQFTNANDPADRTESNVA